MAKIETSTPHALLTKLADDLDAHPISRSEARAVRDAARGLSADAPLNVDVLDALDLSPGVEAALVFSWLVRRYPDEVKDQLRAAKSVGEAVRGLLWDEDYDDAPDFASRLHEDLLTRPEPDRPVDTVALERQLEAREAQYGGETADQIKLRMFSDAELPGAELFPGATTLSLEKTDEGWQIEWTGPLSDGEALRYGDGLTSLNGEALDTLRRSLVDAKKAMALGPLGKKLLAELPAVDAARVPPRNASVDAVERFLRIELGAHAVGHAPVDALNDLIEAVLEGAAAPTASEDGDPLHALFGVSEPVPARPVAADEAEDEDDAIDGPDGEAPASEPAPPPSKPDPLEPLVRRRLEDDVRGLSKGVADADARVAIIASKLDQISRLLEGRGRPGERRPIQVRLGAPPPGGEDR